MGTGSCPKSLLQHMGNVLLKILVLVYMESQKYYFENIELNVLLCIEPARQWCNMMTVLYVWTLHVCSNVSRLWPNATFWKQRVLLGKEIFVQEAVTVYYKMPVKLLAYNVWHLCFPKKNVAWRDSNPCTFSVPLKRCFFNRNSALW